MKTFLAKIYKVLHLSKGLQLFVMRFLQDQFLVGVTGIIFNDKNLGYTKANNQGIRLAQGRYILCLNSDTVLQKDTIKIMIEFMDKNMQYAGATCKVLLPNGEIDKACHRGFPTPWAAFTYFSGLEKIFSHSKIFSQYHQEWLDLNSIHDISVISGAFLLIRRNIMNKIGLFDEQFFMYGEDIDLCYRLNKLGYKIAYNPNTKIIHYKKQSGRSKKKHNFITQKDLIIKERATNYFYETMKIFYDKHYKHKYSWLIRHLVLWGIWGVSRFKN